MYINKVWLEELGLAMPNTTEQPAVPFGVQASRAGNYPVDPEGDGIKPADNAVSAEYVRDTFAAWANVRYGGAKNCGI